MLVVVLGLGLQLQLGRLWRDNGRRSPKTLRCLLDHECRATCAIFSKCHWFIFIKCQFLLLRAALCRLCQLLWSLGQTLLDAILEALDVIVRSISLHHHGAKRGILLAQMLPHGLARVISLDSGRRSGLPSLRLLSTLMPNCCCLLLIWHCYLNFLLDLEDFYFFLASDTFHWVLLIALLVLLYLDRRLIRPRRWLQWLLLSFWLVNFEKSSFLLL